MATSLLLSPLSAPTADSNRESSTSSTSLFLKSSFVHNTSNLIYAPSKKDATIRGRCSRSPVTAADKSLDYIPKQFREGNLKDGLMENFKNVPQYLYGLSPSQMDMFMTEDNPVRRQAESVTEETISSSHNYLNHGGMWTLSGTNNRGPAKYSMSVSMYRGGGGRGSGRPRSAPPDLPSLLLDARICYLGMPIVPAVTELLVAQFMWLDYDNPSKPIYLYINSSGTQNDKMETVGSETEAYAIADIMSYCKSEVYTVNCGSPRGFLRPLQSFFRQSPRITCFRFSAVMAPVLSRSLTTASVASLPYSPLFSSKTNTQNRLSLRSAVLHQNGLKNNNFSCSGLQWKVDKRGNSVVVKCEASAVAEKEAPEEASGEKHEYQAEVSRLMNLIVHSLYSHKEIFLRELVSNASDALDKLRFSSVTDPSLLGDAGELEIRIKPDPEKGTITISDTGIGMTREELIDCLGTIAQSGTSKFLSALKENKDLGNDNSLIGQFGVGFYSAFLVAEKVIVSTKSPRSDKQYIWEAAADSSSYVIREETDPEKQIRRGTEITLFLKDDDKYEFTEPSRIQGLVKNYSQFVSFPIFTWQEKSRTVEVEEEEPKEGEETPSEGEKKKKTKTEKYWDWELANETKPIWMRNPKEIERDQYNEFYKKTFSEFLDPLAYTHFTTEGEVEFRSVIYIPGMAPMNNEDVVNPKTKNIRLYVKRVFISDDFDGELFPRYLSFVKGVVDSNDLPLNVSREILQESRIVRIMRKRLVRKTFDMIQDLADSENKEDYRKFWENFGKFVKLGCIEDTGNHKRITPLLRFFSSKSEEELISLDQYIDNMDEKQNAIYYIATDSLKSAKSAPFLEKLVQKNIEVLYLIEPIDEVAIQNLQTYKEKKFVDVSKEDLELGDADEVKERESKQEYILLCDWMKQQLGDKVAKVQISNRLSSSPCVLVSGKFGWSANMERLMKAQTLGDTSTLEFMRGRRIMEVNPDHPIIKDLNAACKNSPESSEALRAVDLLYETALISSGFTPDSPAELGGKIYEMMAVALGGRWGRVEESEAAAGGDSAESESEVAETEVVEPSEVRTEDDPWST